MFGGKGFYIALAVCLLAAGTIGYITLFSSASPVREPDPVIEIKPAPVTPVPAPPTKPVIQPEPVEVPVQEPVVIEEPVELLPEVVSPLDGTTVTVFSMTELLYDQTMADWRTHNGIDVQAEEGAAVKTAADGTVVSVTDDELMGTTVVIEHSGGYTTHYSSLQADVPVAEGQAVHAGDVIGCVGSTSAAESEMGPHLHFSVSQNGSAIDPHAYIDECHADPRGHLLSGRRDNGRPFQKGQHLPDHPYRRRTVRPDLRVYRPPRQEVTVCGRR